MVYGPIVHSGGLTQRNIEIDRKKMFRQSNRQTDRQTNRQTEKETVKTNKRTYGRTDYLSIFPQEHSETHRNTPKHTHTNTNKHTDTQ